MRIFIGTGQDIDRLAASAKSAGLTLGREPHDTPWGSRAFDVSDPSGFKLTISSEPWRAWPVERTCSTPRCGSRSS